ncbi:MAG: hypothetical protein CVT80_13510 [Alphaproteobacteria bacterium HGW-Alphaproteobacteria-2]|nr:MAG: hypothetical protein CVT80_13510 [Alphaproteobacteria bacterium HGW-Alphaproteobacteria-2]
MKAILALAAALAFALGPTLAPGFEGFRPEQYPIAQENPPVVPAGYAFAIWGLIYPWLLASAAYGLFMRADDAGWDATRAPLIVSLAVGATWLAVAMQSAAQATVLIWVMLAGALAALFPAARAGADRWWLVHPLSVYAGWLTAASWVALGLAGGGYLGGAPALWAAFALAGALATTVAVQRRLPGAPGYGLAVIWALAGLVVRNAASMPLIAVLAGAGILGLGLLLWRHRRVGS